MWPWAAVTFTAEDLTEKVEEREELLHAADHVKGEQELSGLPGQSACGAVFLWIFL